MRRQFLTVILAFIAAVTFAQQSPFDHIEPPFWWADMNNPQLQLLVHGDNIGGLTVSTEYEGVEIEQVIRVKNNNYLFVDLNLENAEPGVMELVFHNSATREIITVDYELKKRKEGSAERKGFSPADAIYLLMPDRFANGNPENDSQPGMKQKADRNDPNGRHGGDLKGIIDNLDYIDDMGFTALWLNPYQENDNPEYSYHGYAITDFYNTDPRIGTNDDYLALVDECHDRGMKVIMDYILNHSSLYHWFIEDLPMDSWIHQHETFTRSNFRGSVLSDPHASEYDTEQMLTGWFDVHMPDIDQRNPLITNYLIQNTIWWVEYADLDGIRLDTQPYPYKEMVSLWAERIFNEYPQFNIVGEAWLQKEGLTAFYQKTNRGKGYDSNIPSVTDFPLHGAINSGLLEDEGWNTGMNRIYYTLAQDFLYPQPENNVIFIDNHDVERFGFVTKQDLDVYKMAVAILLTTRGIPQIYYGTEFLMSGDKNMGHGFIRQDFPGGWNGDKQNAFTGENLSASELEAMDFMKTILKWRKTSEAIAKGDLTHFLPDNGMYVYFRKYQDEMVMVVVNKGEQERKFDRTRYNEFIKDNTTCYDIVDQKKVDLENFTVKGNTAYILTF